jgi:hypothetical protein
LAASQRLCKTCWEEKRAADLAAAQQQATEQALPDLRGSPKQVFWAALLRAEALRWIGNSMALPERQDDLAAMRQWLIDQTEARWWIDSRVGGDLPWSVEAAMIGLGLGDDPSLLRLPPDLARLVAAVEQDVADEQTRTLLRGLNDSLLGDSNLEQVRQNEFSGIDYVRARLRALLLVAARHDEPAIRQQTARLRVYAALSLAV